MRLAAASSFRPSRSSRGAICSSREAATAHIGCAVSAIPMSAKVRALMRRAVFDSINSSNAAGYGFPFAMSYLRRATSRDPDAMSLRRERTDDHTCAPAAGVGERLRHFLTVPAPQLREVLRAEVKIWD